MTPPQLPDTLTTGQAAKILHVSEQTVRDWSASGKLQAQVSAGGHRRYTELAVRRLALAERGINDYFQAAITLKRVGEQPIQLLDESWQPYTKPQPDSIGLDAYLNYYNGLERIPRELILHGKPILQARDIIETDREADGTLAAYTILAVSALEKAACVELLQRELAETMAWFTHNAVPVHGVVQWRRPDGKPWQPMR